MAVLLLVTACAPASPSLPTLSRTDALSPPLGPGDAVTITLNVEPHELTGTVGAVSEKWLRVGNQTFLWREIRGVERLSLRDLSRQGAGNVDRYLAAGIAVSFAALVLWILSLPAIE